MEWKQNLKEYESKRVWWLADKLFLVHVVTTFALAGLLGWAGLWVTAGVVVFLWLLTFAIWQEWKNS